MAKTIFYDGTPVTPDWLNSVSSPVFDGQDLDGHRPPVSDGELDSSPGSVKARVETIADWLKVEHTSGLGVQWKPGTLRLATGAIVSIPANVATLPNNATTQFFVQNGGSTVEHGASFPTDALRLATVITAGGAVTTITDLRSALFVPFDPIHGSLSAQTQALRDADTALNARIDETDENVATALANAATAQAAAATAQTAATTGLDDIRADITAIEANVTTLTDRVDDIQAELDAPEYRIVTNATFTVTPPEKVLYSGGSPATAIINPGTVPGQAVEIANQSNFAITISAPGLAIDGAEIPAGSTVRYVWDSAGEFDIVSSGTGGTTTGGSTGDTGGGTAPTSTTSLAYLAANASTWTNSITVADATGVSRTYTAEKVDIPAGTTYVSAGLPYGLGSATADDRFTFCICPGNLTINNGAILTTMARKLGLIFYVQGTLTINGEITMTARGANHGQTGSQIFPNGLLIANSAPTASGKIIVGFGTGTYYGEADSNAAGKAGTGGGCGSGGGGSSSFSNVFTNVAAGTCFSGGAGGAIIYDILATAAQEYGGQGGSPKTGTSLSGDVVGYGSGAGNPGGSHPVASRAGDTGTGGCVYIFATSVVIGATGKITANGSKGGNSSGGTGAALTETSRGGGGSGGGAIYIGYTTTLTNNGSIQALGGAGGFTGTTTTVSGRPGGAGSVRSVLLPSFS